MPDHDGELARGRNRRHVLTATSPYAQEEGPQRTGRSRRCPGRLDQHAACMAAALLRDPPMVGRTWPRLPDARVQAKIAHQLLRAAEAPDVADGCGYRERHHHV